MTFGLRACIRWAQHEGSLRIKIKCMRALMRIWLHASDTHCGGCTCCQRFPFFCTLIVKIGPTFLEWKKLVTQESDHRGSLMRANWGSCSSKPTVVLTAMHAKKSWISSPQALMSLLPPICRVLTFMICSRRFCLPILRTSEGDQVIKVRAELHDRSCSCKSY